MTYQRVFGIVLDSVGIGEAPDALKFGDDGADTLGHIGKWYQGKLALPNLAKLGLSNIRPADPIQGVPTADPAMGWARWLRFRPVRTVWMVTGK